MPKPDERVIKSRDALLQSLVQLLQTQDAARISVAVLCAHARVSRTTFYSHYNDIGDLLDYAFSATLKALKEPRPDCGLDTQQSLQVLTNAMELSGRYSPLFNATRSSDSSNGLYRRFREQFVACATQEIQGSKWGERLDESQCVFLTGGLFAWLEAWHAADCQPPLEQAIQIGNKHLLRSLDAFTDSN